MDQHPDFKSILLTRHGANETICVSAYKTVNGKFIVSEQFCDGVEAAARLIERSYMREDIGAIWTNLQRLKPGSHRRKKGETCDAYTNILVDIDRRWKMIHEDGTVCMHANPKADECGAFKCNATDTEREVLHGTAQQIGDYLTQYATYVLADSGNGYHVAMRCEPMEPSKGEKVYSRLLSILKQKFERPGWNIEIDISLADETQVVTAWGTFNRKYPGMLERPQRQSKILFMPKKVRPASAMSLEFLLIEEELEKQTGETVKLTPTRKGVSQADPDWLENYGVPDLVEFWSPEITYEEDSYDKGGEAHHPIHPCPCHEGDDFHEHSHPRDCEIIEFADGGVGISCFSGELSLKQVIAKMNAIKGENYPHRVFAEESDEEIAKTFGVESADATHAGINSEAAEVETKRNAFKEEGERTLAAERDVKKEEALKTQADRVELGHWVEDIDGVQFMTKITAVSAASVKPKAQRWLWQNRIPAGAITWGVGKPGNAKSLWATDLAARVSSGADFPDGAKNESGPQKVLMYAGEDDRERTVVPRLIAAGANLSNITLLDNRSFEVFDKEFNRIDRRSIDLSQDCGVLSQLVKSNPGIALLIIDPTTGVYGNKNTNHDKDMRPVMSELRDMCEARGLTIVGVTHTNKRGDAAAIDQIQGASSIAGAARAAWLFTRDPDSDDEHAHMMTCVKGNLSDNHDGMKLLTKAVKVSDEVGNHPMILWGEATKMQADEANQALKEKRESKHGKRGAAKLAVLAMLGEKPMLSADVYKALEKQGHSSETIKRAAGELTDEGEIVRRQKSKRWYMLLPEQLYEFEQEPQPEQVMALTAEEAL